MFLSCLNKYSSFNDVLEVKLKRGLSEDPPTSTAPTQPTQIPVTSPNRNSTGAPTRMSSQPPAETPTSSSSPSHMPSLVQHATPSSFLGGMPSIAPQVSNGENPTGNSTPAQDRSTDLMAAIGGTVAILLVVISCIYGMWWRIVTRPKRSKPDFALTSKDGQLSIADPKDMIPGFVKLDQRSLAETSLGEQTAGDARIVRTPLNVRQTASFDEDSLYTTSFSTRREDALSRHQTQHGKFVLDRQAKRNGNYDRKILYPISGIGETIVSTVDPPSSSRTSPDVVRNPESGAGSSLTFQQASGGDTPSPVSSLAGGTILTKTKRVSQAIDDRSSAFDLSTAFDIDTWSCDYEEFELGSEYYAQEGRSRSPSHSSRSTAKVKNLSLPASRNGKGQGVNREPNTLTHYKVDGEKSKRKSPPDPPEQFFPNAGSNWSSMIQQGSFTSQVSRMKRLSSPLSMLFDSVTQTVSSPVPSNPPSFPAVTPEETDSDFDPTTDLTWSREEDDTLDGVHFKDEASVSSSSTGCSESPWLFEKVEESLGPRSASADMESLSGRSNLSTKSTSHRSRTGGSHATRSVGSKRSFHSSFESSFAPRTLEHDLRSLEKQLEALDNELVSTSSADMAGGINTKAQASSERGASKTNIRQKKFVVTAPPGRLGVILSNRKHGKGIIVAEIRPSSVLHQMLSPGDTLIGVDDDDVTSMTVSEITELMASRADRERRLSVMTSTSYPQ